MATSIKINKNTLEYPNAGYHNSIYRGISLGSTITDAQFNEIDAGTFSNMFIGDYWTINSVQWTICHFNYYWRIGDTEFNKNHLILIPRGGLGDSVWKDGTSPNTNDGYKDSYIRKTTLANYSLPTILNNHAATPKMLYPTTHTNGKAASWAWIDSQKLELLNEPQVYGHQVRTNNGDGDPYEDGVDKWQFNIFKFDPSFTNIRANWWLRSVNSGSYAAVVGISGTAADGAVSYSFAVRPRLVLVK